MNNPASNYLNKGGNADIVLAVNVDSSGKLVTRDYNLWITSFNTSVNTQFSNSQTHQTIVHVPIRRSEQLITFTVDWPLQVVGTTIENQYDYNGFRAMNQFHNDLRAHQKLSATTVVSPPPMNFTYYNNYYPINQSSKVNTIVNNNLSRTLNYTNQIKTSVGPDYPVTNPVQSNLNLQPLRYQGWILQVSKEYDRFKSVYSVQYVMNVLTPVNGNTDIPSSIINKSTISQLLPTTNTVLSQGQNWTQAKISMGNGININGIPG